MPERLSARVERLENLMGVLADKQAQLDAVLVLLTEEQIKTERRFRETDERFRELKERFRETDERFRETDERLRRLDQQSREFDQQSRERDRALDDRVDKLVSAIGEFVRRRDGETR